MTLVHVLKDQFEEAISSTVGIIRMDKLYERTRVVCTVKFSSKSSKFCVLDTLIRETNILIIKINNVRGDLRNISGGNGYTGRPHRENWPVPGWGQTSSPVPLFSELNKTIWLDVLIKNRFFKIMKINNVGGDISDISVSKEPLLIACIVYH